MNRLLLLLVAGFPLALSAAQQRPQIAPLPTTAFHAVSYIEVTNSKSARSAAASALKTYRASFKEQDGLVRFDSFEQSDRPGHFVFIETWRDQDAFDKRSAAVQKQLVDALQPIRISDLDRRPYKTFSTAIGVGPSSGTIYVITHVDASPQPQLPMLLQRLAEDSRRDDGNLRFDIIQHTQRANHYTVIEAWRDRKALDAHVDAAHTKQYRDEFAPMAGSPVDERVFQALEQ